MESDCLRQYLRRRQKFYDQYGYRWPETLNEPTDLLEAVPIRGSDFLNIKAAASAILDVYASLAKILCELPKWALTKIGLPPELVRLCRACPDDRHFLMARLDLICAGGEIKLLECNFDSPGLIIETFEINRLAALHTGRRDPNEVARLALQQHLTEAVMKSVISAQKSNQNCNAAICCRGSYSRDVEATDYIAEMLKIDSDLEVHKVILEELTCRAGGLYDGRGHRIDVLIRLCPLFDLIGWGAPRRQRAHHVVDYRLLGRLCATRKLVMINTPLEAICENKSIQALIWKMAESGIGFSQVQLDQIRRYMLPTSFRKQEIGSTCVAKPISGHGGRGVLILDRDGELLQQSATQHPYADGYVYQQYRDAPKKRVMTEYGKQELRVIMSVWVVARKEVAVCYRAGNGITDASWWVGPVYLSDDGAAAVRESEER